MPILADYIGQETTDKINVFLARSMGLKRRTRISLVDEKKSLEAWGRCMAGCLIGAHDWVAPQRTVSATAPPPEALAANSIGGLGS